MIYQSTCAAGASVSFPAWQGERHYMVPFTPRAGLPAHLARFADTVARMLQGVDVHPDTECYVMVDEAEVRAGSYHRRPGLHVDGFWHPDLRCHGGGGGGGHNYYPGRHGASPRTHHWTPPTTPSKPAAPSTRTKRAKKPGARTEALLLASSHTSARAYVGSYERDFEQRWAGGDCSDLPLTGLGAVTLRAGVAWHLDVFSLHESLPLDADVRRTLVRINVPLEAS